MHISKRVINNPKISIFNFVYKPIPYMKKVVPESKKYKNRLSDINVS